MAYTTIKKPSDYFNTKLYTGTGVTQSITGVGFQPDWTWIKKNEVRLVVIILLMLLEVQQKDLQKSMVTNAEVNSW
jgi:hypothetical protein